MIITRYLCDDHEIRGRRGGGEGYGGDPGVAALVAIYQGIGCGMREAFSSSILSAKPVFSRTTSSGSRL